MSEWMIQGVRSEQTVDIAVVKELELHDEWMGECFLTISVKSAEPIEFSVGDFIDYRNERYTIEYDPTVLKKARRSTYGEGFTYDNIKFVNEAQAKVVRCDFTDIVLSDNKQHYTSLPTFPFYCESVDDLLDRIQANLDELYGKNVFTIIGMNTARNRQRGGDYINEYRKWIDPTWDGVTDVTAPYGSIGVPITADNIGCWDALSKVHTDFNLNFIMRGYTIVVGTAGMFTASKFKYGKGNGLYEIEKIGDSEQQIVTRLRAYGAETNLPLNYYANKNKQPIFVGKRAKEKSEIVGRDWFYGISTEILFNNVKAAFNITNESSSYLCGIEYNGTTAQAWVTTRTNGVDGGPQYLYFSLITDNDQDVAFYNALTDDTAKTINITSNIKKEKWPASMFLTSAEFPQSLVMNRLMLPGFPDESLYAWATNPQKGGWTVVDANKGTASKNGLTLAFSKEIYRPYIDSPNTAVYGIRPGSIYFDGNGDTEDIHPSITGSGYDQIVSATQVDDQGVYNEKDPDPITITIPGMGGFKLDEAWKENESSIDITDGMCGGRSFQIVEKPKLVNGNWECKCKRAKDDSLHLWFPYCDFQINANGRRDHFVLTGIDLPDEYVELASERLFDAAIEALRKNDSPRFTYQPRIDEIWMQREDDTAPEGQSIHDTLKAGDIFQFEDEDMGIDAAIIIDVLTIKENGNNGLATYEVTLRDEKQVSTIQKIQNKIDSLATGGNGVGSSSGGGSSATAAQIESLVPSAGADYFLSKNTADEAKGIITFLKGIKIGVEKLFGWNADGDIAAKNASFEGDINVGGGASVSGDTSIGGSLDVSGKANRMDEVASHNYTGAGLSDTGWKITTDNGSGSSEAIFDYLTIRKKMIVNSLEIKETHFTAGDIAQSCASCEIARTDYIDGNGEVIGYSVIYKPWMLKGRLLSLFNRLVGNMPKASRIFGHTEKVRMTLTTDQLKDVRRVRCYILAKDGDREIENWWRVNDMARCQTWNVVKANRQTFTPDFSSHDGNIYWWRTIKDVSWNTGVPQYVKKDANGNPLDGRIAGNTTPVLDPNVVYVNEAGIARLASNGTYSATVDSDHQPSVIDGNTYHWFDVAYNYVEEQAAYAEHHATGYSDYLSDIPAAGDKVVQFGNTTDPDRMNITLSEINGSGNPDAPDIKILWGVYTFSLEQSWWGGVQCPMKLSPATGYDFYGPHFRFITEQGVAQVPIDRPEKYWTSISFERDEYHSEYPDYSDDIKNEQGQFVSRADGTSPKSFVRKCRYYDRLTHNGSLWLCSLANNGWYWRATAAFTDDDTHTSYNAGDVVPNYAQISDANKALCEHLRVYTNQEPTSSSNDWTEQVGKGDPGAFKSRVFCRSNDTPASPSNETVTISGVTYNTTSNPVPPPVSGQPVWYDGAPDGKEILWSSTSWFYSDGSHSNWTPPCPETDTANLDIEFSPNYNQPSQPPVGTAENKDTAEIIAQRHAQGWYDPVKDKDNPSINWNNMIWRAERKISNGVYVGSWEVSRIKGESANRLDLSNEMDMVQTDSTGKVTSDRDISTVVHLYEGASEVNIAVNDSNFSVDSITYTNASGQTQTLTPTKDKTGVGNGCRVTFDFQKGMVISAQYSVGISFTYHNVSYSGELTIVASMGQPIYQLKPTMNVINFARTSTNALTPSERVPSLSIVKIDDDSTQELTSVPSGYTVKWQYDTMPSYSQGTSWTTGNITTVQSSTTNKDICIVLFRNIDSNTHIVVDRETIPIMKDGENGANADEPMQAFQWNNSNTTAPSPLPNGANLGSWSATAPNRPATTGDYFLWLTQTTKHTAKNGTVTYDAWSPAVRISGDTGSPGEDSSDQEFIYKVLNVYPFPNTETQPKNISQGEVSPDGIANGTETNKQLNDWVPNTWSDRAIPAAEDNKYVYASVRTKSAGHDESWGDFSAPFLWSNWGVQGLDGDGVQYIYKLYPVKLSDAQLTSFIPLGPTTQNASGEWLPATAPLSDTYTDKSWMDDPEDVSKNYPYCYCSIVKEIGGAWQKDSSNRAKYGKLAIWSTFSDSPWIADLDNEMDSVACTLSGNPDTQTSVYIDTNLSMFYGSVKKNYKITSVVRTYGANGGSSHTYSSNSSSDGVTVNLSNDFNTSANTNRLRVTYTNAATITGKDDFAITMIPDDATTEVRTLHLTINGVRPGANGEHAVLYRLVPSCTEIVKKKGGGTEPSGNVTCSVTKAEGNGAPQPITTGFTLNTYVNDSSTAYGSSTVPASIVTTKIVYELLVSGVIVDRETIPVVADGNDGESAWVADLGNQMDSVSCDETGHPVESQTVSTNVNLFYGSTEMDMYISAISPSSKTDVTISPSPTTAGTANKSASLSLTYGTSAVISGKDEWTITLKDKDNTVEKNLTFTVNGVIGDVYNLNPSVSEINAGADDTTAYLKCGYTKNVDGTISIYDDVSGQIDSKYNIYFARRVKSTGIFESTYIKYSAYKSYINSLDISTYDAVEFVLSTSNATTTSNPANIIDRETVPVVRDGEQGPSGNDGKYKLSVYQASLTTPTKPDGTSVDETELNEDNWWFSPDQAASGASSAITLSYTNTGVWTRSGNVFTSPATTAHSSVYRSRISFTTTSSNVRIRLQIIASSEANYDFGCIGDIDTDMSSQTAASIKSGTFPAKVSGTQVATCSLVAATAGEHFFDIVYAKDSSSSSNNDNATVAIVGAYVSASQIWECQTWVDKNAQGVEYALGWSDPVKWNGVDGPAGARGNDGLQGCVIRTSEYESRHVGYRNDEGKTLSAGEIGYIDVVGIEDENDTYGYAFYRYIYDTPSTASTPAPPNSTYWEALSNVGSIYTSFLVAKNAHIKFGSGNQFIILNDDGDITAGMKGTGNIRFWGGSTASSATDSGISSSPFRVYEDGSVVLSNAEVSGTIKATNFYHRICYYFGNFVCFNGGEATKGGRTYTTSGYADVIEILQSYLGNWIWGDSYSANYYTILLPDPSTCEGKMVTVYSKVVNLTGKISISCVLTNRMVAEWTASSSGLTPYNNSGDNPRDNITIQAARFTKGYRLSSGWSGSKVDDQDLLEPVEYVFVSQKATNGTYYWFEIK